MAARHSSAAIGFPTFRHGRQTPVTHRSGNSPRTPGFGIKQRPDLGACKLQAREVHRPSRACVAIVRSGYRGTPQMGHQVTKGALSGVLSPPPERAHAYTHITALSLAVLLPLALAVAGPIAPSKRGGVDADQRLLGQRPWHPELRRLRRRGVRRQHRPEPVGDHHGQAARRAPHLLGPRPVASAVKTAKADAAKNRMPWMSFKPPYSWADMAAGKGDAWARDLATKMKAVGGPVWVAVAPRARGRRRHPAVEGDAGPPRADHARRRPEPRLHRSS